MNGSDSDERRRRRRGRPLIRDLRFKKLQAEPLGEGAAARVWKVRDEAEAPFTSDRVVAAKELKREASDEDRERLLREGGADRRFDHPHLVRIFELRGGSRSPYVVMECIDGRNAFDLLKDEGPFDPERVAEIGEQLCHGLDHMHARDVLHRDVTLRNTMVVGDLAGADPVTVKLIDLGTARASSDPGPEEVVVTTPYAAPEILDRRRATVSSDVYSLGMVLYRLATDASVSRCEDRARDPRSVLGDPDLPVWLRHVIATALARRPGDRFPSAAAIGAALAAGPEGLHENATTVLAGDREDLTLVRPRRRSASTAVPGLEPRPPLVPVVLVVLAIFAMFAFLFLPFFAEVGERFYELSFGWQLAIVAALVGAGWLAVDRGARRAMGRLLRSGAAKLRSRKSRASPKAEAAGGSTRGELRHSLRPWVGWAGQRGYVVLIVASIICLALWLGPAVRARVAVQPGHHAALTAIAYALWILIALLAVRLIRRSAPRPRALLLKGALALAILAAAGMAAPPFVGWLGKAFWPGDYGASARVVGSPSTSDPPTTPRAISRRLAARVRGMQAVWLELVDELRERGWNVGTSVKPTVREAAASLSRALHRWVTHNQFQAAARRARDWIDSMGTAATTLVTSECEHFEVTSKGADLRC